MAIQRIQELATTADVAKALGMGVVRRGSNNLTICPFHSDNAPSLTLYDHKAGRSHYHCYACGAHGDVFALVQQVLGIDFIQAVDWLGDLYGIARESKRSASAKPRLTDPRQQGLKLGLDAFLHQNDHALLEQFASRRNLPSEFLADHQITAVRGNSLIRELMQLSEKGAAWREAQGYLESAGLLKSFSSGWSGATYKLDVTAGLQDAFADDRIVLPLRNRSGQLVGFAARKAVDDNSDAGKRAPKYLFSAGTPKSTILYGAQKAFDSLIREGATDTTANIILVEGAFDALRLQACKLPAVALLGSQATEAQLTVISSFAEELDRPVLVLVFLDRDVAGIKGAAKLCAQLTDLGVVCDFLWPTDDELANISVPANAKDPDEIFSAADALIALDHVNAWRHPPALALLADQLRASPNDLLTDAGWGNISSSRRAKAFSAIAAIARDPISFLAPSCPDYEERYSWFRSALGFYSSFSSRDTGRRAGGFVADETARLNLARALACSGVQRGDMAPDLATWRRLDIAATAFNEAVKSRLQQRDLAPLEPFDAMYVSRGFGKSEPRLKVMPCAEDLVVQQYLLNALLTEIHDSPSGQQRFSRFIPAVRFYREDERTITTGGGAAIHGTLSFAYQIDMDVLEGRQPPSGNGIFRPYFHCWRDFISHLRAEGEKLSKVHVLRLDVRRYYDELGRGVVRDILLRSVTDGVKALGDADSWIPLLRDHDDALRRAESTVDWLCDQSFGFSYFDPADGEKRKSPSDRGIPQGPVLSAWLGSIALSPLDDVMRRFLAEVNGEEGVHRAAYARYVDDLVLVADSPALLAAMRARAEDVARRLALTLVQKAEPLPAMATHEFSTFLTEGRAFATSEPDAEPILFDAGDGEAGWQMLGWGQEEVQRYTSLHLLHDRRLYDVELELAIDQLYTALRASDLRPKDLSKAARWLWLHAAQHCAARQEAGRLWSVYLAGWEKITRGSVWELSGRGCAWEDPAFYALEGLEKLLDFPQGQDPIREGRHDLVRALKLVAREVQNPEFIAGFRNAQTDHAGAWGSGTAVLRRMFWNHALPLQMKAVRLLSDGGGPCFVRELQEDQQREVDALSDSLTRARITHFEALGRRPELPARAGGMENPLRYLILWLHSAFGFFQAEEETGSRKDPLDATAEMLPSLRTADTVYKVEDDRFAPLLQLLLPSSSDAAVAADQGAVAKLAFATLIALVPWKALARVLAGRRGLAEYCVGARPFPVLPGIVPEQFFLSSFDYESDDENFAPLVQLKRLTQSAAIDSEGRVPLLGFQSGAICAEFVALPWEREGRLGEASDPEIELAQADVRAFGMGSYLEPPNWNSGERSLKFAADVFEALAYLNRVSDGGCSAPQTEYVPAWPYFAFRAPIEQWEAAGSDKFALLCAPIASEVLGNQAFVRVGSAGLKPVSVPSELAHLWRAGVAVSDLVGLADDVDRYQRSLEQPREWIPLQEEVLLQSMRRLRGCFFVAGAQLAPDREKPYLPATLSRVLRGMREFPEDQGALEATSYAIGLQNETNAMAIRMQEDFRAVGSGSVAYLLERAARLTVRRLPRTYVSELPIERESHQRLRRTVSGWRELASRFDNVPAPRVQHVKAGWNCFLAGLRIASVSSWLRSFAVELCADGRHRPQWSSDLTADVTSLWGIEEPCLGAGLSREEASSLSLAFRSYVTGTPQRPGLKLDDVTPLGWLAIVSDLVGLMAPGSTRSFAFKGADGEQRLAALEVAIGELARQLAEPQSRDLTVAASEHWPFDFTEAESLCEQLQRFSWNDDALGLLDEYLGYSIAWIPAERWAFDPSLRIFTDGRGEQVPLLGWQIQTLGEGKAWSRLHQGKYLASWTETRSSEDRLLGVSVLLKSFGDLVARVGADIESESSQSNTVPLSPTAIDQSEGAQEPPHFESSERLDRPDPITPNNSRRSSGSSAGTGSSAEESRGGARSGREVSAELTALQGVSWRARSAPSDTHLRVAVLQWQVDDTYVHPLFDTILPDNIERAILGEEVAASNQNVRATYSARRRSIETSSLDPSQALLFAQSCAISKSNGAGWNDVRLLPSWKEHRRRTVIGRALDACKKFGVNVLVLPEYAVRPDTVVWLAEEVRAKNYEMSVYAGTYRLFGDVSMAGFESALSNAFGFSDRQQIMRIDDGHKGLAEGGQRSSILTLVTPVRGFDSARPLVSVFTRRKKYPSAAAGEVFNPSIEAWRPLYTLEDAATDIEHRGWDGLLGSSLVRSVTREQMLQLASDHWPEQYLAELICSEIFLATSPANISSLAEQYRQLLRRFGRHIDYSKALDEVFHDLKTLGRSLGHQSQREVTGLLRRSVLAVPAMTSRSADYWIFGQAGLLAAGLTTIFCNASCANGRDTVGGSCVVGHNSWKDAAARPGMHAHITPYSGWSRGIYYNRDADALGRSEQALAIIDIDPVNTNAGKPRPQTMCTPLTLVAHIPIVETLDNYSRAATGDKLPIQQKAELESAVGELVSFARAFGNDGLWRPGAQSSGGRTLRDCVDAVAALTADPESFKRRTDHWALHWRDLPWSGPAPAAVDFLWVDHTPAGPLPEVFVPPWSE